VGFWPKPLVHNDARIEGRTDQAAKPSGAIEM
jgi:hypothetical protein